MPALPIPQQSDWSNNVFVVATTRIFVVIVMGYLIKSLYDLMPSIWGTRSASTAADAIALEDIVSDAPVTVPSAVGTSPDLEANLTLEARPLQPSYGPQDHAEGAQADARAQNQSTEVSGTSTAAHAVLEQDVDVGNGDAHNEEMDIAIGVAG